MRYLSAKDLAERFGVSLNTIWNWASDGPYSVPGFPQPVKLSSNCTRWKLDDIESWEASRGDAA